MTKLDEDDTEPEKEIDKKVIKYVLECDLSKPELNNLLGGIKEVSAFLIFRGLNKKFYGETSTPLTYSIRRKFSP